MVPVKLEVMAAEGAVLRGFAPVAELPNAAETRNVREPGPREARKGR